MQFSPCIDTRLAIDVCLEDDSSLQRAIRASEYQPSWRETPIESGCIRYPVPGNAIVCFRHATDKQSPFLCILRFYTYPHPSTGKEQSHPRHMQCPLRRRNVFDYVLTLSPLRTRRALRQSKKEFSPSIHPSIRAASGARFHEMIVVFFFLSLSTQPRTSQRGKKKRSKIREDTTDRMAKREKPV